MEFILEFWLFIGPIVSIGSILFVVGGGMCEDKEMVVAGLWGILAGIVLPLTFVLIALGAVYIIIAGFTNAMKMLVRKDA